MDYLVLAHTKTARILHWFNMFCITLLVLTGFYIHSPLQFNIFPSMDVARKVHFVLMYLVIYGLIVRIYYAFIKKEIKEILFVPGDFKCFLPLMKYYCFMNDKPPETGKYNAGQKMVYTAWVFLLTIQAITGFILYMPTALAGVGDLLGGIVYVRYIHYGITWLFVYTVAIHIYMSVISGRNVLRSIVTGYLPVSEVKYVEN